MKRHANLTIHARRLTPIEVAQHWFRRGADFSREMHTQYRDFPKPGADGLYLLSQIEAWFDRMHGRQQISVVQPTEDEENEAMRAASGR